MMGEMKLLGGCEAHLNQWGIGAYEAREVDFVRNKTLFYAKVDTNLTDDEKREGIRRVALSVSLPTAEAWTLFRALYDNNHPGESVHVAIRQTSPPKDDSWATEQETYRADERFTKFVVDSTDLERSGAAMFENLGEGVDSHEQIWAGSPHYSDTPLKIDRGAGPSRSDNLIHMIKAPLGEFVEKMQGVEKAIALWENTYRKSE